MQGRPERVKNISPLLGFDPRTVQLIASRYTDYAVPVSVSYVKELFLDPLNPLKPELNPICYLLALLGAHHFIHVSRIRVKLLTLR